MNIDRELQRLQDRVARISTAKNPPTLKMLMVDSPEEIPEDLGPWILPVYIEPKQATI